MRLPLLAAVLGSAWFVGCGGNTAFLAERSRTEAHLLQESCKQLKIESMEVKQADALTTKADQFWKEGKADPARVASEEAQAFYQVALTRYEEGAAQSEASSVAAALGRDKEKLATYTEILDEMKKTRKP